MFWDKPPHAVSSAPEKLTDYLNMYNSVEKK